MSLGFPGQSGELWEIIGRDAFLEALSDGALRIRVLDQQPKTLDEALAIVCRMEAYGATGSTEEGGDEVMGRRKVRSVNVSKQADMEAQHMDDHRVRVLDDRVAEQSRELRQLRADAERNWSRVTMSIDQRPRESAWSNTAWQPPLMHLQPPPMMVQPPYVADVGNDAVPLPGVRYAQGQPTEPPKTWRKNRRRIDDNRCRACLQEGHWQRDVQCPLRNKSSAVNEATLPPASVNGVSADWPHSETYLDMEIKGMKAQALIDSGCDKSVAPLSMVEQANLRPTKM